MPGIEQAEKNSVSNEHAEQTVGTCWCFMAGDTPDQVSSHRVLLLVKPSCSPQPSGLRPQPWKFWSSNCEVESEMWIFNKLRNEKREPLPLREELHF